MPRGLVYVFLFSYKPPRRSLVFLCPTPTSTNMSDSDNESSSSSNSHLGRSWEIAVITVTIVVILGVVATTIFSVRRRQRRKLAAQLQHDLERANGVSGTREKSRSRSRSKHQSPVRKVRFLLQTHNLLPRPVTDAAASPLLCITPPTLAVTPESTVIPTEIPGTSPSRRGITGNLAEVVAISFRLYTSLRRRALWLSVEPNVCTPSHGSHADAQCAPSLAGLGLLGCSSPPSKFIPAQMSSRERRVSRHRRTSTGGRLVRLSYCFSY
ncbi:hypothetical protein CYLTODRAFT_442004 [Cylindrobasidium torrendii FP15055 ss-10]|uniref:Uncharacterized protein n=1 Tax=Cylindrobasidium torrendii FP15055 ss-10 TaxID=1314674 RepID=A0A0D7BJL6_9AGAR|nr:hypothetical protein CYLTODRAFT_442004 [Cylindrobasidium torrendii FP15055 ss-10]